MSSLPVISWAANWSVVWILCLLAGLTVPQQASSQAFQKGSGVLYATDWPDRTAREELRFDVLPFVDTLAVSYEYQVREGMPVLAFFVDWVPGDWAMYRGVRTPYEEVPGEVRLAGLDLRMGVQTKSGKAANLSLVVDSMVVGPRPDFVEVSLPDLTWDNVFVDATDEEAKAIFLNGFELVDLEVAGAAFALFDEDGDDTSATARKSRRSQPQRVSIYRAPRYVDVFVDVSWLIGGFSSRPSILPDNPRGDMGRGDQGRVADARRGSRRSGDDEDRRSETRGERDDSREEGSSETRDGGRSDARDERSSGSREGGVFRLPARDDDDEDDDDDRELVPYAIAAAATAGILAAVGGTIGYYGNSRYTPLGLTSGFVGRDGGLLLQAGVNEALLLGEPKPKRLMVKLLSFGNFLNSGLQPALGAGVLATSEGDGIEYEPSVSIGAVGSYRMLLVYGGYDVMHSGPEFSIALNLREFGWGRSNRSRE